MTAVYSCTAPAITSQRNLSDWGAADSCTRAGSVYADQARLVRVIHVLSAGTRGNREAALRELQSILGLNPLFKSELRKLLSTP
jgi:hypothetical protein